MALRRIPIFICMILFFAILWACGSGTPTVDPAYVQEIQNWHKQRIQALMAPNGWPALAGLFWLEKGDNTFGSRAENQLVFPAKAPDTLGTFRLEGDSVFMQLLPGYQAEVAGEQVRAYILTGHTTPPIIHFGDFDWILIQRTDKFGIRLWDRKHTKLQDTIQIERYPIDASWRIPAVWIPDSTGQTVKIRNVLDMEMDMETEGRLSFTYAGQNYELVALDGGEKEFFIVFADATTGETTYGGGRYLYVDKPDSTGHTYLDFNKAYNPPCAFTEFATCLLPPAENRLELSVTAGELSYGEH